MARPRKYIVIQGQTIDGVSRHRSGRFYTLDPKKGIRTYFQRWEDAQAAHIATRLAAMSEGERASLDACARVRYAAARDKLRSLGRYSEADDLLMEEVAEQILMNGDRAVSQLRGRMNAKADELGVPQLRISEANKAQTASAVNPRVSELAERWLQGKINEASGTYRPPRERAQLAQNPLTTHQRETLRRWRFFCKQVGNIRIRELGAEHFRRFFEWADREAAKPGRSPHWHVALMVSIKMVFTFCQRHYPDWDWPRGLEHRIRSYTKHRYSPADHNAEPMPREVLRRLLQQCDAWASTDSSHIDATTASGTALRRRAIAQCRDGVQLRAVLLLLLNAGLNLTDIQRLTWQHLRLDHAPPHLELPREKMRRIAGRAIERRTPLLPETIAALRAWQAYEPSPNGWVFRTDHGTAFDNTCMGRAIGRLLEDSQLGRKYTAKHLRNAGPTVAANAGLPEEMIQRFLGHQLTAVSRFYKGRAPVEYLKPIVDEIERVYLREPSGSVGTADAELPDGSLPMAS